MTPKIQHKEFIDALTREFPEEFHADELYRGLYSTDASIYQQKPLAALMPKSGDEVRRALQLANQHKVPVLPRAAGTSLAGQTTADGALVIDISKHLNRLLELNKEEMWALAEPGVIRDTLNAQIVDADLMFAPETSTSNRANVGGMIGNNSSGMMSIRYGITGTHLLGAKVVLADGTETWFGKRSEMDETGKHLLDELLEIMRPHREMIAERFPKVIRRVGGYSLDHFLQDDPNLSQILAGSEGTLAFMSQVKLNLVKKPKHILAIACHYADMLESLRSVPLIVSHHPLSAEFMDGELVQLSLNNPSTKPLCGWVQGKPEAVIAIEADGDTPEECIAKLEVIEADLKKNNFGYAYTHLYTPEERWAIAEVRKAGLGVTEHMVGDYKPISFIEDACVPVEHLADYADGIIKLCEEEGLRLITYGHASVGVLHLKPIVNLKTQTDRDKATRISRKAMELCRSFGGSWSGEHGDGIARGAENERFWGPEMMEVFRQVKQLFDPEGIMNPGKIFDTPPVMGPLRYTNGYQKSDHKSMFHFRDAGGFQGAVEMCSGVGQCRKLDVGTMCPSFMVTHDERDTTRGRANMLRLSMAGQLGPDGLTSQEVYEALDLCLECKACKTECPTNVDMAKMKSEFLHAWHEEHGTKLREKVFAFSPKTAPLNTGWRAPIVNGILGITPIRKAINKFLGVATERPLPKYARETFPTWFKKHKSKARKDATTVVLFNDTYVNYHEPEMGKWAVWVLEALGYRVVMADAGCCCRPMISKGFLADAKRDGTKTLQNLDKFAKEGLTIVGIEPSCVSSLKGDLGDLVDDEEMAQRVADHVMPIEEFIDQEVIMGRAKLSLKDAAKKYFLHGHCHQKSLFGTAPLKRLMGNEDKAPRVEEVDSGCCGMAGSFGYEAEHYELSQKVGEDRLFPAVRATPEDQPIIANGFSCRHQIEEGTGRKPMHFIEALGRAMGVGEE